jgi:hypothetical protein
LFLFVPLFLSSSFIYLVMKKFLTHSFALQIETKLRLRTAPLCGSPAKQRGAELCGGGLCPGGAPA